mmetsp:Transcript_1458/g.4426  ORF Transcript_1458/g.4426 Transcript_1458/m.4426 type:complete len:326 (-) Transcript_1458:21-998(-)
MKRLFTTLVLAHSAATFAPPSRKGLPTATNKTPPRPAGPPTFDEPAPPPAELAVPATLPATPSPKLVAFLWANTLLLAPVALAGAALGCKVLGERWAWSAEAARLGVAYALPWIALSFVPLDRWFPAMADVTAHTELLTATALGVERGGVKRWGGVLGATALVSASAGILEEAAFRGVLQRAAAAGLRAVFTLGRPATVLVETAWRRPWAAATASSMAASYPVASAAATTLAIGIVAGGFGALHDYCRGYALLAALAGAYFGLVYAATGNLLVAAVAHATVDAAAFLTCYVSLCRRSASEKAALAAKSFQVTDALRATRARLETA